jgi:hypothetical protein
VGKGFWCLCFTHTISRSRLGDVSVYGDLFVCFHLRAERGTDPMRGWNDPMRGWNAGGAGGHGPAIKISPQRSCPLLIQVEDIVNTAAIFKGVSYFKTCEEPA